MPDSANFFEEVNEDINSRLEIDWTGDDLDDGADDHVMSPMTDLLQCLGVSAADSANYCAQVIKDSPKRITSLDLHTILLSSRCMGRATLSKPRMEFEET